MRLQQLIRHRKYVLGLTQHELVERSATAGHPVALELWARWEAHDCTELPTTETILGVAAALRVTHAEVLDAAGASLGVTMRTVPVGPRTRAVLALLAGRTIEDQALVAEVLRAAGGPTAADDLPGAAHDLRDET